MPWGTLAANVVGGLAIGAALAVFERRPELSAAWRPFLVTGLLGALTTFSTFSAESLQLIQRGALGHALLHTGAHLLGSL
ncbi:MAG TPA: CrcB family protein, partial [Burkholderiaceae bacterium]|nr:CrcB family protein [Burkholderiaceae bacterium]